MVHNKQTMIEGIKNLLKTDYGIDTDLIDVEAEVDNTLTFEENWRHIKDKYIKHKDIHTAG